MPDERDKGDSNLSRPASPSKTIDAARYSQPGISGRPLFVTQLLQTNQGGNVSPYLGTREHSRSPELEEPPSKRVKKSSDHSGGESGSEITPENLPLQPNVTYQSIEIPADTPSPASESDQQQGSELLHPYSAVTYRSIEIPADIPIPASTLEAEERRYETVSVEEIRQMRIEAAKQVEELKTVLHHKLEKISEQFPVFRNFPIENIWRLCIDARYHDKGPICLDDEPFFVPGVMRGLSLMLDGLGKEKLTAEYLERLHDECIKNTFVLKQPIPGGNVFKHPSVLRYRTEKLESPNFTAIDGGNNWTTEGIIEMKKKYSCRKEGNERDYRYGDKGHPVGNICLDDPSRMQKELKAIALRPLTQEECRETAASIIDQYYKEIKESGDNPDKKLEAIMRCCQDLDQVHLFRDGNIRTIAFLVLPKLLIENGFLPTSLYNPNVLDLHSVEQITPKVTEGQKTFEALQVAPVA